MLPQSGGTKREGKLPCQLFVPEEEVLHVEAQAEVALVGLDPVASRALGVLDLPERQGAELGAKPLGELGLFEDQVLPPGALPVVEVVPPQDFLLLHEHRGPRSGITVASPLKLTQREQIRSHSVYWIMGSRSAILLIPSAFSFVSFVSCLDCMQMAQRILHS